MGERGSGPLRGQRGHPWIFPRRVRDIHLRHPLLAIDRLFDLTEDVSFIEYVEAMPESGEEVSLLLRRKSKKAGRYQMLPTRSYMIELLDRAGYSQVDVLGSHRREQLKEKHEAPGFQQQRVLLKATR